MKLNSQDLENLADQNYEIPDIAYYYEKPLEMVRAKVREMDFEWAFDLSKNLPSEKILRHLYQEQRMSLQDIGEKFAVSRQAVHDACKRFEIQRRTNAETQSSGPVNDTLTPAWMQKRVEQGWTNEQMADELDVSKATVSKWRSTWRDDDKIDDGGPNQSTGPESDDLTPELIEEALRKYETQTQACKQLADHLDCHWMTVNRWRSQWESEDKL